MSKMSKWYYGHCGTPVIPGYEIEWDPKSECPGCHSYVMQKKECKSCKAKNKPVQFDVPDEGRSNE